MLYDSGITPPLTPDTLNEKGGWPITAAMWTQDVNRFRQVDKQKRGDIVANGKHCGIAIDDDSNVVAAGQFTVNTDYKFYDGHCPTIQRYEGF